MVWTLTQGVTPPSAVPPAHRAGQEAATLYQTPEKAVLTPRLYKEPEFTTTMEEIRCRMLVVDLVSKEK